MTYRHIDHTADTGLVVEADTLEELFRVAAIGMFDVTYGLTSPQWTHTAEFAATGDGYEDLLVNWLSDLLTESDIRNVVFSVVDVLRVTEHEVRATVAGVDSANATLVGPPIKAVTYHGLVVEPCDDGWRAEVIFDV